MISVPRPRTALNMNTLEERLKEQKRLREQAAKASHRPHQYTPVDIGDSSSGSSSREDSGSGSSRTKSQTPRILLEEPVTKKKPLPPVPVTKKGKTKPAPLTKPKPGKPTQELPPQEPPQYANCNFGSPTTTQAPPPPPPEDECLYMNVHATPTPPTRRPRPTAAAPVESTQTEYQNIGHKVKSNKRRMK